jgi:hypothetical protein
MTDEQRNKKAEMLSGLLKEAARHVKRAESQESPVWVQRCIDRAREALSDAHELARELAEKKEGAT